MIKNEKKLKVTAVGTLNYNVIMIDDNSVEWLDAAEFSLASLGKLIGIDGEHKVRARITLEIVQEPCEICGKITTGDKLCSVCSRVICDECARVDATGRYCQTCFETKKSPTS